MKIKKQKKIRDILADRRKNRSVNKTSKKAVKTASESRKMDPHLKCREKHDQFVWMLKAGISRANTSYKESGNFNGELERIIKDWWRNAFGARPFPTEGKTVNSLQLAIRYELIRQGRVEQGLDLSPVFLERHKRYTEMDKRYDSADLRLLDKCDLYNVYSRYTVCLDKNELTYNKRIDQDVPKTKSFYLNKEDGMAVKKTKTTKTTKKSGRAVTTKKVAKKKAPAEKKAPVEKKAPAEKKLTGSGYACQLLMERKYTDDEIFQKVTAKFPAFQRKFISPKRNDINNGRNKNFDVGDKPLVRLVRDAFGDIEPFRPGRIKVKDEEPAKKSTTKKVVKKKAPAKKVAKKVAKKKTRKVKK